jgi:heme-degrading monooxygenase HmoA
MGSERYSIDNHVLPNAGKDIKMVTIGMNYEVVAGKEAVFEKSFDDVLAAMADMPGHSASYLFKDVKNPRKYLIISEWSEEQAFAKFIHSDTFAEVTSWAKAEILTGRPTHKVYVPKSEPRPADAVG